MPVMPIRLYNSLTRRVEEFRPLDRNRITMYLCGPTVYHYVHIGNARGPVVFDVLARLLRREYGAEHVMYARNITDVDDKINAAAQQEGVPIATIAERYAAAYEEDMAKLGVQSPDIAPKATAHIAAIVAMCARLIEAGHAYAAEGHVLFDVASYREYGQLSGRSVDDMIAGARVEIAPYKKNPADFVLWKPSSPELPGWDSPWGRGRPGWHIECSAMAQEHLGETIDIHAGGNDLMFPHHENEIAQSTCAHDGTLFARFWLHNGMLTFDGRKMSKSLGNVLQLHELLQQHRPEDLRFMLLRAHYRQPLDWSDEALKQAKATLDGWYGVLRDLSDVAVEVDEANTPEKIEAALCDDLNTPEAFAELAELAKVARRATSFEDKRRAKTALLVGGKLLGLLTSDPEFRFKGNLSGEASLKFSAHGNLADAPATESIDQLIEERRAARAARDFKRADEIRDQLAAMGVAIEDGPQGTRWKMADS